MPSKSYSVTLQTENYSVENLWILALDTFQKLNIPIEHIAENLLDGRYKNNQYKINTRENQLHLTVYASTSDEAQRQAESFIYQFQETAQITTPAYLDQKFQELQSQIQLLEAQQNGEGSFQQLLMPTKNYWVTPILIYANVLIFILMIISGVHFITPESQDLINWGANFKPYTLGGQFWRVLTACFLHIGILHLLMNMYALLYIGVLLEPLMGSWRFMFTYLLTGIVGSVASLWWNDIIVSAGASGAIFGMYGVFLAMLTTHLIAKEARQSLLSSIGIFVAFNLLNGLRGGIDNAGHIGGLLSGVVIGYAFVPILTQSLPRWKEVGIQAGMLLATIGLSVWVFFISTNDVLIYEQKMQTFASAEQKAIEIYGILQKADNQAIILEIQNSSIPQWEKCIQITREIDKLKLPAKLKQRNQLVKEYTTLRKQSLMTLLKVLQNNSESDINILENYNMQIEQKLKELKEFN